MDLRLSTRALYWDRGCPARSEREARKTSEAGTFCEIIAPCSAGSGRDARGPSEEVEWSNTAT